MKEHKAPELDDVIAKMENIEPTEFERSKYAMLFGAIPTYHVTIDGFNFCVGRTTGSVACRSTFKEWDYHYIRVADKDSRVEITYGAKEDSKDSSRQQKIRRLYDKIYEVVEKFEKDKKDKTLDMLGKMIISG